MSDIESIELPDFIVIAERVLNITATQLLNGYCRLGQAAAALAVPFSGFGDTERYPHFHEKAAAYCEAIVRYHPLVDGNKRMGYVTMLEFVRRNGRQWTHGRDGEPEAARAVEALATESVLPECFANWVGHRISRS